MLRKKYGFDVSQGKTHKGTRPYNIWRGMRQRCGLIAGGHKHDVERYAERGITVCDEWKNNCDNFVRWAMVNGYKEDLYIDRIDVDKGYSPDNCRWVTVTESNRNKSTTLNSEKVAYIKARLMQGVRQSALAKEFAVSDSTIFMIKAGKTWPEIVPLQG